MKKILFILILLLNLTVKVFADDTPALRNSNTNTFYTNLENAMSDAISNDTFDIGIVNSNNFYISDNLAYFIAYFDLKDYKEEKIDLLDNKVLMIYISFNNFIEAKLYMYFKDGVYINSRKEVLKK